MIWLQGRQVMDSKGTQVNEIHWVVTPSVLYYCTCNSAIFFQIIIYYMITMIKPLTLTAASIYQATTGGQALLQPHRKTTREGALPGGRPEPEDKPRPPRPRPGGGRSRPHGTAACGHLLCSSPQPQGR